MLNKLKNILTDQNILLFYLVLFNIQLRWIEGGTISIVKVAAMGLAIVILFIRTRYVSKALLLGILLWLTQYLSAIFHPASFRFSTIGYSGLFIVMYICCYNMIYKHAIDLGTFIRFLRLFMFCYIGIHLAQQVLLLIGIRRFPLLNIMGDGWLNVFHVNSLHIEPSIYARTMGVLMYSYLKCKEIQQGAAVSLKQLISKEERWLTIGFLWAMFTMGSGTAIIVICLLSLYFMQKQYVLILVPAVFLFYTLAPLLHNHSIDRVIAITQAMATGDVEEVISTDSSAAARIAPLMNKLNMDLRDKDVWFGHGVDYMTDVRDNYYGYGATINQYGLICYIASRLIVYLCCMHFVSLPTLMFFVGVGGGTGNIAYCWGLLLLFTVVRYFEDTFEL